MANMTNAINAALGAGYTMAEIDAARYAVQKGGNRRYNAVMNLANNPKSQQPVQVAPQAPTPVAAPTRYESNASTVAQAKERLRTNKKTTSNKTKLGISDTNIQPLNTGVFSGYINI